MKKKQNGYMYLADGSIHSEAEGSPKDLFVSGYIQEDKFFPEGDIEGKGPLGTSGYPGWMELFGTQGTFHGMETARPPFPPYVEGYMTPDGFQPSSRRVIY
jgi:hypothetical protein